MQVLNVNLDVQRKFVSIFGLRKLYLFKHGYKNSQVFFACNDKI